jgi:4'-phosphopantetheinyl transferase
MNSPGNASADDLPAPVGLGIGEIRVWHSWLQVPARRMPELEAVLSADERARAGRFVFEHDRIAFVAARAALRSILAQCTGADAASVQFEYGPTGKPELTAAASAGRVRFNLSHSGPLAIIAVTLQRAIGVDVEYMGRELDYERIAHTFFSAGERAQLAALTPELRRRGFFNCWTRKEAFLKATGEGISGRHAGFDVSLAPGQPARLLRIGDDPQGAVGWSIHAFEPAPGYVAAVAIQGECTRVTSVEW